MAVIKAKSEITLFNVTDIKAYYRYYLLQNSTLSKPSKPTTFPPPSSWDDIEPSYTDGSTNSLYFVDCTEFNNGDFQYSEVSLSSSYEAAKEAWNKARNAQDTADNARENIDEVRQEIVDQNTAIISSCNEIILSALESYVQTSNYEDFKQTVESQLSIMADKISMNFTTITEQINEIDSDQETKFTELYKYISFSDNGIKISAGEGEMSIRIDNDIVIFEKGDTQFGWWDGIDFHTGNIVIDVTERAQFGNFAFVPRTDGSLSFLKVANNTGFYASLRGTVLKIYAAYPTIEDTTMVITDISGSLSETTLTLGGEE